MKTFQKTLMLFILLLLQYQYSIAQFSGARNANPPSIKWMEIENNSTKIIYPQGLRSRAERVANLVDYLNHNNRTSIGEKTKKIPIILQNQLVQSNGFVSPAPMRSEFFTTAPQVSFAGTEDWLDLLAIHEYRHVMQFQNSRHGITLLATILFGDSGYLLAFLATPLWFAEGDAVMQETLLSKGGRGRSSSFLSGYRAMHQAGKNFSYEKLRNGSFKHYLPNRYKYGYLMLDYGRRNYGNQLYKDISIDAVRYKGYIWAFSKSMKKRTGLSTSQMYHTMVDSIYQEWDHKNGDWVGTKSKTIQKKISEKHPSYYSYPFFTHKNKIVCLKSGMDYIPTFYSIKNGKETKLFTIGRHDSYVSYSNGKMVWTQNNSDIRWANKTFSNIYIYDFKTKKKRKLTEKSKLFAPSINKKGDQIIAIKSDELMQYSLQIIDAHSGNVINSIPNKQNKFISTPQWLDKDHILAVTQYKNKNALVSIDIKTGQEKILIDYTNNSIVKPKVSENYIFFTGGFTEATNIFAFDRTTKELYQVTNSNVLASDVSISKDEKTLLYRENHLYGSDLKTMSIIASDWLKIEISEPYERYKSLESLVEKENGPILSHIPKQEYKERKFNSLSNLINIHNWSLLSLHSTNLLSTFDIKLSLTSQDRFGMKTEIEYNKYYPQISIGHAFGFLAVTNNKTDSLSIALRQNDFNFGIKIPLIFSTDAYHRYINFQLSTIYSKQGIVGEKTFEYHPITSNNNELKLSFSNNQHRAFRALGPRWGQNLNMGIEHRNIISDHKDNWRINLKSLFYFPGIMANHKFSIQAQYSEILTKDSYDLSTDFKARGYDHQSSLNNLLYLSIDYELPLLYPDIALGKIAFFKRFRSNFFFDYSSQNSFSAADLFEQKSIGVELRFDFGLLRYGDVITVPIGVRYSHLLDKATGISPSKFELIFSQNLPKF